jgi:crotonobetainyl-CoA:carnitine CoA-transferase CaiB-like acyl-CoA transferase
VLGYQALNYLVTGDEPHRAGNSHPNIAPYDVFPVSDGDLIIAAGNDHQYRKLCEALGADELGSDPRFAVSRDRVARRDELTAILHALTRRFTRAELLQNSTPLACPPVPSTALATSSPIRKSLRAAWR